MKGHKNLYVYTKSWAMLLLGLLLLASCVDDEFENRLQTTGKNIGFHASYPMNTPNIGKTRSAQIQKDSLLRLASSDSTFSLDVYVEEGIRSHKHSQKAQTRGTQITATGDWKYNVGAYYKKSDDASYNYYFVNHSGGMEFNSNDTEAITPYYWPVNGEMTFFAVAPCDDNNNLSIPNSIDAPTITYTIPEDIAQHTDIMVAQSTIDCPTNDGTIPVSLQFQHLLAAVQFKVGDMQLIQINSLSVSGIKGGTITMTYENDAWSYTSSAENVTYTPIFTTEGTPNVDTSGLPTGTDIAGKSNGLTMLVMPQEIGADATVTIDYKELITGEEKTNQVINLGATAHNWVAGQTTVYTLNIDTDISIEIPTPPDADAHYTRVDMTYNLAELNGIVTDITAYAAWEEDGTNTASEDKRDIALKTELSPTQEQGYFTDELWELSYSVDGDGNKKYTKGSDKGPVHVNSIIGSTSLPIPDGSSGTIYLFLDENDGTTDRNGVLHLVGTVKETNERITIGVGRFKQLCPSWNSDGIGVERFEDEETHPYGFSYDRQVKYINTTAQNLEDIFTNDNPWDDWLGVLWYIFLYWTGAMEEEVIPNIEGMADGFVTKEEYAGFTKTITINYSALNAVKEKTHNSESNEPNSAGLENTRALYNHTGDIDIKDFENQLDEALTGWGKQIISEGNEISDYAAFIALTRNRMRELVTTIVSSEGEDTITEAILHKVGEGGTNNEGDESGEDIIEWYLPSVKEAEGLIESGNTTGTTPTSPLNGTYWSSNAGDDPDPDADNPNGYAYSYTYSNNEYKRSNPSEDRTAELKVRAVRKKP